MKTKTAKVIAFIIVLSMVLTSFSFVVFLPSVFGADSGYAYGATKEEAETAAQRLELLSAYIDYIKENFKDDVSYEDLINGAYDGVIKSLDDEFSEYYKDIEKANEFESAVDGTFEGIGVQMNLQDNWVRVIAVIKGTPAYKAGIQTGDIFKAIDGVSLDGKSLNEVTSMLRGKAGTKVKAVVERNGKQLTFEMVREKINEAAINYEIIEGDIGHISINGFDADTDLEFVNAYTDLKEQGAKRFIIDLRDNVGGYIDHAISIADYILEGCEIAHYEKQGKIIKTYNAKDGHKVEEPIVVLTNGDTASASELLCGALQDNGVKLVGTRTYGKGIAQNMLTIADGHKFKISIFYFLTPNKNTIQKVGITPDFIVENTIGTEEELVTLKEELLGFAPMAEGTKPVAGDVGLNVYAAQQRLIFLGYDVTLNATMDAKTVEAVKTFQKDHGLYSYAKLDFSTMNALHNASVNKANGKAGEDLQLKKAIELLNN